MIYDSFENIGKYVGAHPLFEKAARYLEKLTEEGAGDGHYVLSVRGDDGEIFANVITYDTKSADDAVMEAHGRYVDLQYIVSGRELIFAKSATSKAPDIIRGYEPESDYALYAPADERDRICLDMTAGTFAVFFPGELHAAGISPDGKPEKIHKIVIKILF